MCGIYHASDIPGEKNGRFSYQEKGGSELLIIVFCTDARMNASCRLPSSRRKLSFFFQIVKKHSYHVSDNNADKKQPFPCQAKKGVASHKLLCRRTNECITSSPPKVETNQRISHSITTY